MYKKNVRDFSSEVKNTKHMAQSMTWSEITKFILLGAAKLAAFGIFMWIIKNV